MANIKLTGHTWDTSGIWDATEEKTQNEINSDLKNALDTTKNLLFDGGEIITKTGTTIFLTEKEASVAGVPEGAVIYGRNRFDLDNTTITQQYSASNTLTKEKNGIKVVRTQASGTVITASFEYTAEFTGDLFVSCDADYTNRIEDLAMAATINGASESDGIVYGKGQLWLRLQVVQGDTIVVKFYTKITNASRGEVAADVPANTVYYSNIMLAYGGLYNYEKYVGYDEVCKQGDVIAFSEETTISYLAKPVKKTKKMICFGDSITGMYDYSANYPENITYSESEIEAINAGFAGCSYTDHATSRYTPFSMNRLVDAIVANDYTYQDSSALVDSSSTYYSNNFAEHLANIKNTDFSQIDYLTIFFGTNDWGSNKILLSENDTSEENKQRTNVEDAVRYCVNKLLTKYPNLKIILITPYWRDITYNSSEDSDSNVTPNSATVPWYLYDGSELIADIADEFNIPSINLYRSFGANKFTCRYFTKDGTHPTNMGKKIISERIVQCASAY